MSEAAEDVLEGLKCSHCDVYFNEAHGFPVYCGDCFDVDNADQIESYLPQAEAE